ncbi:hypothetical protein [Streptomyces sp. NPDC094032]|uniref:hypothetical protein n=1 Tax=Streptomyces sp. NPDC094032 TaxID=3155308 RepID=UPI003327509E
MKTNIMGSSYAFPVMATSDAAEAFTMARRLLRLAENRHLTTVDGQVRAADEASLRRLAVVVPEGADYLGQETPLALEVPEDIAEGTFEEAFVGALGDAPAWLRWDVGAWPAATFGYRDTEYSGVQIAFNSRDLYFAPPPQGAESHMLYICVGMSDLKRARWLARQVGLEILGTPVQSL